MSYESWRIGYQSSEQAARAAYYEIANLSAELAGAKKSRNAAMQLYESSREHRDHLLIKQREWQEALATLDSERAANALLTAKLAAAEARAEQSNVLTDDMLRYAMAALGTNCPADADLYRAFWFHAITMRETQRKLAEGDAG